jgi:hypothetical protein
MIYPEKFPQQRENHAEFQVFRALEKLGDDFDVFYNKSFARKHPKEALLYEVDFLVFDLRGGKLKHIFVIEAKGGSMTYSAKHNQWKSGEHYLEVSPESQAMGYVKNLLARYHEILEKKVPVTWLLWFPDGVKTKREYFPTHLSEWRVLDQYALGEPAKFLDQAILSQDQDFGNFPGASIDRYEKVIKKELSQSFELTANLQAILDEMQDSFEKLEQQQQIFFSSLMGIPRLSIEGCAGSGKSFLAKSAAIELSTIGKKCLFICFNKFLKYQVIKAVPQDVRVDTVLNFLREYIEKKDAQWTRDYKVADQRLLESDIPKKVEKIIKAHPIPAEERYDVIIIDEAQDMNEFWIRLLMRFLKGKGQVFVFYDRMQNIFQRSFDLPPAETWIPISLNYNHRNAKSINAFINETLALDIQSGAVPEGLPVKVKSYREENLAEELDKLLVQLLKVEKVKSEQITILVDGSTREWDIEKLALTSSYSLKWLAPDEERREGEVSITSINHFKGSEAEIIILILKEALMPISNENIRYTQLSRAKGGLWVLEKNLES